MRKWPEKRLRCKKHQRIIDKGIKASSNGCMRTTITLDPDVAARIDKEVAKGEQTFKEIVNAALRKGLERQVLPKRRFVQRTWEGGEMLLTWPEIKQLLLDDDVERYR